MDILEEHSQDCLLRSQAPLAAKYRCMMCARPVQVINPVGSPPPPPSTFLIEKKNRTAENRVQHVQVFVCRCRSRHSADSSNGGGSGGSGTCSV